MKQLRFVGGSQNGKRHYVGRPEVVFAEDAAEDVVRRELYTRRTIAHAHPRGAYFPRHFEDVMVLDTLSADEALHLCLQGR